MTTPPTKVKRYPVTFYVEEAQREPFEPTDGSTFRAVMRCGGQTHVFATTGDSLPEVVCDLFEILENARMHVAIARGVNVATSVLNARIDEHIAQRKH